MKRRMRNLSKGYHAERETLTMATFRQSIATKEGHTLQFFYNPENNLVIVDLVHKNVKGGNELLRTTLDPKTRY